MRSLQLMKTLFRTPFKTFLTFLLLSAVTFVFFSRVSEYSVTNKEIKNLTKEYRGIGTAEISPAPETLPSSPYTIYQDSRLSGSRYGSLSQKFSYQPLSQEQISSLSELPYVSSLSTRYMTPGVSDKYYRMDEGADYYNYTSRFIIEGTLSEVNYGVKINGFDYNNLILDGCTVLAGTLPASIKNKKISIEACANKIEQDTLVGVGSNSGCIAFYDDSFKYDSEYIKKLALGGRYVFVGRYDPLSDTISLYLSDILTDLWCEAIQPVEGQPDNYLETKKFAPLKELIELTNSDLHTFDVVYTDNMSAIMRFAEGSMAIKDGRELTKEDSDNGARVCVVSSDFASANQLGLGDKITLKLGTELFAQYKGLGAVAGTRERYSRSEKEEEFEIVGIYIDTDGIAQQLSKPNWSYSINTVFVPKSLLPLGDSELTKHKFSPSEVSFMVDNAWDIPSFLKIINNGTPTLKKMGLKIIFNDGGWPDIVDKYKMSIKLSLIAIIALSVAVIASTVLIVYLFIGRKKKEYAILRALGTSRKESVKALILPFMILSITAILTGSCIAWIYTTNTISKSSTFSQIKDHTVDNSIPINVAVLCILGEIFLVLIIALYRIWRISTIPPLMLLQDNQSKKVPNKKRVQSGKSMQSKKPVQREKPMQSGTPVQSGKTVQSEKPLQSGKTVQSENPVQSGKVIKVNNDDAVANAPIDYTILTKILNTTKVKETDAKLKTSNNRHFRFVLRYIAKHIRRTVGKSILSILLITLLFGAVGQFDAMRQSYITLCKSTEIKAKFINGFSFSNITRLMDTGYVTNPYYEYKKDADFNYSKTDWVVTNNIAAYTDKNINITYGDGYDEACMKKYGEVCVISDNLLKANGLKLGDKVHVTITQTLKDLQQDYINKYKSEHPDTALTDDKILEQINDELQKELLRQGLNYTIVGTFTTQSDKYENTVFSPGTLDAAQIFGEGAAPDLAEFKIIDNLRINEFRRSVEEMFGINTKEHSSSSLSFIMDTSKIDNLLKTLSLFEKLLPVVLAVAVLIEGLVCGLIILHTSKEVAILRVLGTTRRKTCVILILEQIIYCIFGLILGALGLLLYNGPSAISEILEELYLVAVMFFAGCFTGSLISGIITSNRKVLDLLQSKE